MNPLKQMRFVDSLGNPMTVLAMTPRSEDGEEWLEVALDLGTSRYAALRLAALELAVDARNAIKYIKRLSGESAAGAAYFLEQKAKAVEDLLTGATSADDE